jgi:predicted O-methyltransferase YrrM
MRTPSEMHKLIDIALQEYAKEIDWNIHPPTPNYWHMEAAITYSLIRATNAKRILEIGTGYGNSTKFIAEAARKNGVRAISIDASEEPNYKNAIKHILNDFDVDLYNIDCHSYKFEPVYDFIFIDADHGPNLFKWYVDNVIPRTRGWLAVHDIDVNADLIASQTAHYNGEDIEAVAFNKMFSGQYVSAREMFNQTSYRPASEGPSSGWENGSVYMLLGD